MGGCESGSRQIYDSNTRIEARGDWGEDEQNSKNRRSCLLIGRTRNLVGVREPPASLKVG